MYLKTLSKTTQADNGTASSEQYFKLTTLVQLDHFDPIYFCKYFIWQKKYDSFQAYRNFAAHKTVCNSYANVFNGVGLHSGAPSHFVIQIQVVNFLNLTSEVVICLELLLLAV